MRNKTIRKCAVFVFSLLLVAVLSVCVSANEQKSAEWDVSADGSGRVKATLYFNEAEDSYKLVISGNGKMKDFSELDPAPWLKAYAIDIITVEIGADVENIGAHSFVDCSSVAQFIINGLYTKIPMSFEEEVSHSVVIICHPNSSAGVLAEECYNGLYKYLCIFRDSTCTVCSYVCSEHIGGAPTCEQPAVCDICGVGYGTSKGHNPRYVSNEPATCTLDGIMEHKYCDDCGAYFDKDGVKTDKQALIISASHSYGNLIPPSAPTCVNSGNEAYYVCSSCNKYFDGQKREIATPILPATEQHSGGNATCSNRAVCETCNMEYGDTDPTSHTFSDKYTYGTEKHWRYCTCGERADYRDHVFNEDILSEPTEDEEGRTKMSCDCGYSYIEIIPKLQPDEPPSDSIPQDSENREDSTGIPIWVICLISIGMAVTVIAIALLIKKKWLNKHRILNENVQKEE